MCFHTIDGFLCLVADSPFALLDLAQISNLALLCQLAVAKVHQTDHDENLSSS
jgi:hypothetical protein